MRVAAAVVVARVAVVPRPPPAAPQLRPQAQLRRPAERRPVERRPVERRVVERRRRVAPLVEVPAVLAVAAGVAAGRSPALRIPMAHLTPGSPKWLATPTVCRRCSHGRPN
jgi:hypothetical protein